MSAKTLIMFGVLLASSAGTQAESGADAYGRGDYGSAVAQFERSAQGGDATAQNNLGVLYLKGRGVAQDYGRARELFQAAAEQHLPGAMFNLGMMYLRGYGVTPEATRAADWFQRAAALDDREAQFFLAVMYTRGQGVSANADSRARRRLNKKRSNGWRQPPSRTTNSPNCISPNSTSGITMNRSGSNMRRYCCASWPMVAMPRARCSSAS